MLHKRWEPELLSAYRRANATLNVSIFHLRRLALFVGPPMLHHCAGMNSAVRGIWQTKVPTKMGLHEAARGCESVHVYWECFPL